MQDDQERAKEKVILLMQRERELFAMRMKYDQANAWLRLAQSLPQLFVPGLGALEIYGRLRKVLLTGLRLQRVLFFDSGGDALLPLAPAGEARAASAELSRFLTDAPFGFCNDPSMNGLGALSEAVGLHRFYWSLIRVGTSQRVLLTAGFDLAKSAAQTAFDESTAAHFDSTANYIGQLFQNHQLVSQLKAEKEGLEQANRELLLRDRELETVGMQLRIVNESLERRVSERTVELYERNRDLLLVLDNVDQAFLTIDREERLSRECSAVVGRWFGAYAEGTRFADFVAPVDALFAESFRMAYEALLEDVLPLELCVEQLPKRLHGADVEYACRYFVLQEGAQVSGLVIMVSDVTDQTKRARREAEYGELLALFARLAEDRIGYWIFVSETERAVEQLSGGSLDLLLRKRLLHTLKGNAASVGATVIARLCHVAEDKLQEWPESGAASEIERLQARWQEVLRTLQLVAGHGVRGTVEVSLDELDGLALDLTAGRADRALEVVQRLRTEPAVAPLKRLARSAEELARRLGRVPPEVRVVAPDLRLDHRDWASLWTVLVHVVNNAIVHGLEGPEERLALGKPIVPLIRLTLQVSAERFEIEIADDGRGIDWERIHAVAAERGLPRETPAELVRALLAPGVTSTSEVTTSAGRGIGLSAVDEEVRERSGTFEVASTRGGGTRWKVTLPARRRGQHS